MLKRAERISIVAHDLLPTPSSGNTPRPWLANSTHPIAQNDHPARVEDLPAEGRPRRRFGE